MEVLRVPVSARRHSPPFRAASVRPRLRLDNHLSGPELKHELRHPSTRITNLRNG